MKLLNFNNTLILLMQNFRLFATPVVDNFLSEKSITLLRIINEHRNIFSTEVLSLLEDYNLDLSKSQFYRYLTSLHYLNLISKTKWFKRKGHKIDGRSERRLPRG